MPAAFCRRYGWRMQGHGQIWQRMMERGKSRSRTGRATVAMTRTRMAAMRRRRMPYGSSSRAEKSSSFSRCCFSGIETAHMRSVFRPLGVRQAS